LPLGILWHAKKNYKINREAKTGVEENYYKTNRQREVRIVRFIGNYIG
jgi:hypothetical protein